MQIIYFPYLTLKDVDEIKFPDLNAVVWNFDKKADDYVTDQITREHVRRILAMNVRGRMRVQGIGVLSIGNTDFRSFTDEMSIVNEVRLRLFLSSISSNNVLNYHTTAELSMGTAENFSFVVQNFQTGNDHIAESAGAIVRQTAGGYTIDELTFQAPGYVLAPMQFRLDSLMLDSLAAMKQKRPKIYIRILRASDLLFRAYFNDPYVDINSRILLVTAAFEILLNLPDGRDQRLRFKEEVGKYANLVREKKYNFWSERGAGRKVREKGTKKVKWVDRLYVLRNHIIHGNNVKPVEYTFEGTQRHIDIAMLFFIFLIQAKINTSLRRKIFFGEILWSKYTDPNDDSKTYDGFEFDDGSLRRAIHNAFRRH